MLDTGESTMWTQDLPEILACMMTLGIPLAAILTHHQRKMAEIIHGRNERHVETHETALLREELARLRDKVNQLTLIVDASHRAQEMPAAPRGLSDRLGS